jgi:hypothetical protein
MTQNFLFNLTLFSSLMHHNIDVKIHVYAQILSALYHLWLLLLSLKLGNSLSNKEEMLAAQLRNITAG